jgi:hypothetical protein
MKLSRHAIDALSSGVRPTEGNLVPACAKGFEIGKSGPYIANDAGPAGPAQPQATKATRWLAPSS